MHCLCKHLRFCSDTAQYGVCFPVMVLPDLVQGLAWRGWLGAFTHLGLGVRAQGVLVVWELKHTRCRQRSGLLLWCDLSQCRQWPPLPHLDHTLGPWAICVHRRDFSQYLSALDPVPSCGVEWEGPRCLPCSDWGVWWDRVESRLLHPSCLSQWFFKQPRVLVSFT